MGKTGGNCVGCGRLENCVSENKEQKCVLWLSNNS